MARARRAVCGAVWCTLLACGEQVLVAHIASEQRAQSDSIVPETPSMPDAGARDSMDAADSPGRGDAGRDAAVDSGSENDGKHDDESDDHDKDHG